MFYKKLDEKKEKAQADLFEEDTEVVDNEGGSSKNGSAKKHVHKQVINKEEDESLPVGSSGKANGQKKRSNTSDAGRNSKNGDKGDRQNKDIFMSEEDSKLNKENVVLLSANGSK